jgi:hypothetical protein
MTAREQLIAYLATLAALVIVVVAAFIASGFGVSVTEAFGLGAVTGGLIGVLRIPSSRSSEPAGTPADPINTKEAP